MRETYLIHFAVHLCDLILKSHFSHSFSLILLTERHLILLLHFLALYLPWKQLLWFVKKKALNLKLNLFHLRVLLVKSFMIFMISVAHVFLKLSAELLKFSYFLLISLTFRGLKFRGQHLGSRWGIVSFQRIYHRFVHGSLCRQTFLCLCQLWLHLIILLLKKSLLLFEFCLLKTQLKDS
jgi:hypothetical protein